MPRRKREEGAGYAKLLDAWTPPPDAGDAVGCVATSYTFNAAFFEEECLGRFLQLETEPAEDGALYLIEREDKLRQLTCAAALVDQHNCRGSRSLRWALLPVRVPGALLHGKLSLLCWSRLVRVVVGSANLTEDGYRRNQEVFGVLDFRIGGEAPTSALVEVLDWLEQVLRCVPGQEGSAAEVVARIRRFLDGCRQRAANWGLTDDVHRRQPVRVQTVLTGPGRPNAMAAVSAVWPAGSPATYAAVYSPFFDPPEAPNEPAHRLWASLRQRGPATVEWCLVGEDVPGSNTVRLVAPESLIRATPSRTSATYLLCRVAPKDHRPLHGKAVWLEDDRWVVYLIGSSNFTTPGLGLGKKPNLEANLAYVVDRERMRDAYTALEAAYPNCEALPEGASLTWQAPTEAHTDESKEAAVLPEAFESALFDVDPRGDAYVVLRLTGDPPPGFRVTTEQGATILDDARWRAAGSPPETRLGWTLPRPPSGFDVRWDALVAFWPVNVATQAALPPPEELRDLPLEVLIDILTSARPLHEVLRKHLKRRRSTHDDGTDPVPQELDPHRRVDTSGFLLQRTRRVARALVGLRGRLERPAATEDSLAWRLRGPVGVMALADALQREARSPAESAFLLGELALELSRVQPGDAPGCLGADRIAAGLRELINELKARVPFDTLADVAYLAGYLDHAFRTALGVRA